MININNKNNKIKIKSIMIKCNKKTRSKVSWSKSTIATSTTTTTARSRASWLTTTATYFLSSAGSCALTIVYGMMTRRGRPQPRLIRVLRTIHICLSVLLQKARPFSNTFFVSLAKQWSFFGCCQNVVNFTDILQAEFL